MYSTSTATLLEAIASRPESLATQSATLTRFVRFASVLFVAVVTAVAAQVSIPLPFTPVPLTLQPPVVLLTGLLLGARLGAASQLLYLAAGIAGLPVFASSLTLPPGALRLIGPTGGYLMAYPIAAFVVGYLAQRGFDRRYLTSFLTMCLGLAVIYLCGVTWLGLFARTAIGSAAIGMSAAVTTGVAPFLLPDLVKLAVAAAIASGLWRLVRTPSS